MLPPVVTIGIATPASLAPRNTVPSGVPAHHESKAPGAAVLMRASCAETLMSAGAKCSLATSCMPANSGRAKAYSSDLSMS